MTNIPDYKQLQQLKEQHNNIDTLVLKSNLKAIIKRYNVPYDQIAALLNISIITAYSYTKKTTKNKPDLYNLLILSSYLNIPITDFFRQNNTDSKYLYNKT